MALGSNLKRKKEKTELVEEPNAKSAAETLVEVESEEVERETVSNPLATTEGLTATSSRKMLVIFRISGEQYGIPIAVVKEVVPSPRVTKVPQAPDHILGMANVRGQVYAVLDVASKLGHPTTEMDLTPYLLVLKTKNYSTALHIWGIPNTKEINGESLDTSYEFTAQASQDLTYVEGLIKENGEIVVLLDTERMVESVSI